MTNGRHIPTRLQNLEDCHSTRTPVTHSGCDFMVVKRALSPTCYECRVCLPPRMPCDHTASFFYHQFLIGRFALQTVYFA